MIYIGQEKVFLYPLKVPGWVWKWNWRRQMNRRKAYWFYWIFAYMWWPSEENDDDKKWPEEEAFRPFRQRKSVFEKSWWDRKICPKGIKWWRSNEEGVTVGLTGLFVHIFQPPIPHLWSLVIKMFSFLLAQRGYFSAWKSYLLLSGKKSKGLEGQSDLASVVFSNSFSFRFWICQGAILGYCILKPNTYIKCEIEYLKK